MLDSLNLLLVEDSPDIAELIQAALIQAALPWRLEVVADGVAGLARAIQPDIDAVILDIQLPGLGGFEICKRLRAQRPELTIVMLTARDSELERVLGLELGADDYLTKPLLPTVLFSRVRAIVRRRTRSYVQSIQRDAGETLESGSLKVELASRAVRVDDRPVAVTALEFDLLCYFLVNAERVVTRAELLEHVWQEVGGSEVSVNTMVNRLRNKLSTGDLERFIRGVRGVGYRLVASDEC